MAELNFRQKSEFLDSVVGANIDAQSLLNDAISFIKSNLNPEDVFSDKDLESWAESNGYEKKQ